MKQQTVASILQHKIIVIVRGVAREDLIPLADAMYEGGIRLIECTYDASGKRSDEEIAEGIHALVEHFGDKMTVGAGTVMTEKQVELTKNAGGRFIISPDTNPDVIQKTAALGLVSIPGAITPTEAALAHRSGADFVKLFPVGHYGPRYLKDLAAPLSHIRFLAAGAYGVGIGSNVVNHKLIASKDFDAIRAAAQCYTDALLK